MLRCFAVVTGLMAPALPAVAEPFTGVYAFGDSLSDAGNVFIATGGAIPGAPYFAGRFSNGPTWIENLAQSLGLGPLRPSLAGGTDFAYGSAVTGPAVPGASTTFPNVTQQVIQFATSVAGSAPSTGLYSVWIGSNDVLQALRDIAASTLTPTAALTDLAAAALTAAAAVDTLAGLGAQTFIVPLVPDIGRTPIGQAAPTLATALSAAYNAALVNDVLAVAASDHIAVHFLDIFSLIDNVVADPAAFGFTDATHPCYTGPFTGGVVAPCATPDAFLFWDIEHPTEPGHQQIAALAAAAVPEPTMLPMFLVAGAILLLHRPTQRIG
jgi:phospholipase/lecithinase/hemolysin